MSKGASPFMERPEVESRATFDRASGFAGAHGMGSWVGWSGIRDERTLRRNPPVKRQGSTWRPREPPSELVVTDIAPSSRSGQKNFGITSRPKRLSESQMSS
jgi:hypothetical protein